MLIIGAGAAGMMCAITAGRRKRKVVLIDHSERIGRKILISGGGRCNFTNLNTTAASFVSGNPHFCKSALSRFGPQDFISLVRSHGIKFHEKKLGQLFCDGSADNIVNMLIDECKSAGSEFQLGCKAEAIEKNDHFTVGTNKGDFICQSLVIATGGLSIPQIGATGYGYKVAQQFGLKIKEPLPALDGFNLAANELRYFGELSGLSIDSIVSCGGAQFRENILFTHNGLSGPASLQASLYWQKTLPLLVNLLPELEPLSWLKSKRLSGSNKNLRHLLSEVLPKRFVETFCHYYSFANNLAELSDKQIKDIGERLSAWEIFPESTVGFKKAEVTKGGVDTTELSSKTMESSKVKGLFFIGEVVDVTGQLGGYNFQWAWSSGFAAGESV